MKDKDTLEDVFFRLIENRCYISNVYFLNKETIYFEIVIPNKLSGDLLSKENKNLQVYWLIGKKFCEQTEATKSRINYI